MAAKKSHSLRADTHGDPVDEYRHLPTWTTRSRREVEAAGVEVFVRECAWLSARRTIDDAGYACTRCACTIAKFRVLLQQDRPRPISGTEEGHPKTEMTHPVVLAEEPESGDAGSAGQYGAASVDVVDLTRACEEVR